MVLELYLRKMKDMTKSVIPLSETEYFMMVLCRVIGFLRSHKCLHIHIQKHIKSVCMSKFTFFVVYSAGESESLQCR